MIIYRVEGSEGNGYRRSHTGCTSLYKHLQDAMLDWELTGCSKESCQPLPWRDGIPKCFLKRQGWFFGFTREHDLVRWFSPHDLFVMAQHGAVAVQYEVAEQHVWKGTSQCVFFKEYAEEVARESVGKYTYVEAIEEGDLWT